MKISLFTEYGALNSGPVFEAIERGANACGYQVLHNSYDADIAVIWSMLWQGRMSPNKVVWDRYTSTDRRVIVAEVGSLLRSETWKLGLGGTTASAYWGTGIDQDRPARLGLSLKPWRQGQDIIIACQRGDSQQWAGMPPVNQWLSSVIDQVSAVSDRRIVIRPHPRQRISYSSNHQMQQPRRIIGSYDSFDFETALSSAWCVINWNSGPGINAIINGVPALVGSDSLARNVATVDWSLIESPAMPDRTAWLEWISHCEWTVGELSTGWPLFRLIGDL